MVPVLVTPPKAPPVSLVEIKRRLNVEHSDHDEDLMGMLLAATAHLDGYTGILGRALVTQQWAVEPLEYGLRGRVSLPLAPIQTVDSVTYLDDLGASVVFPASSYLFRFDGLGPFIIPVSGL